MRLRRRIRRFFRRVGRALGILAEAIWDVVTTVVGVIVETFESIIGWVLSVVAFIVDLILSIPIIGRLVKWILNLVLNLVWTILGALDIVLALIGILPEKKMRLCVIILRDEAGVPVGTDAEILPNLQIALETFKSEANVRLVPSAPFQYSTAFSSVKPARASWIKTSPRPNEADVLDVSCDGPAAREDLRRTGSKFDLMASTQCFYGNFRRLVGYGAPIVIFVVRDISGKLGCSLGPLSDYVTLQGSNTICLAHELGHACNLTHVSGATNLMNSACGQTGLNRRQVAVLRSSRHVTYF